MSKLSEAITGAPVSRESLVEAVRTAAGIVNEVLPVPDIEHTNAPLRLIAFDQVLRELLAYEAE